jgi:peroxiredoxin
VALLAIVSFWPAASRAAEPGVRLAATPKKKPNKHSAYDMRALFDSSGKPTSLAEQADGQHLVVVVLKATRCPVCAAQLERLAKLRKQLKKRHTRVVALTSESVDQVREAQKHLPFPLLSDPKQRVLQLLDLWQPGWDHPLPALVVFDRCGSERARSEGRGPGSRHERELLQLLDKLDDEESSCKLLTA